MSHISKKQKLSLTEDLATILSYAGIPLAEGEIQKAETDDGSIYYNLAVEYHKKKLYSKALLLFRLSAERNNSLAQNGVGIMYLYGQGTTTDYELAMTWFTKSVENDGNRVAQGNIGILHYLGLGVPKSIHKAIEWYIKSGNQGHSVSQYCLGQIYETEREVKDLQKAVDWYKKSLDNGLENAQVDLKRLVKEGYSPRDEEKEKLKEVEKTQIADAAEPKKTTGDVEDVEISPSNESEKASSSNQNEEMIKKLEEGYRLKLDILEKEKAEREKLLEEKVEEIKQLKANFAYYKAALEEKSRINK